MPSKQLTFGSLFAGIGGMDLGLERAGMRCAWQVEIDPYAQRVLAKHWPNVMRHDDVRTFPPGDSDDWRCDLICGGFPCQDISFAGRGGGIEGERSGLWFEYARIIRELRPRYVLVENVAGLLVRGFDRVLGELAAMGFDAEWGMLSAASLGLPHARERLFVVAHCRSLRWIHSRDETGITDPPTEAESAERISEWRSRGSLFQSPCGRVRLLPDPGDYRVAYGFPDGVDRLKGIGNAVAPDVAERIGRRIIESAS